MKIRRVEGHSGDASNGHTPYVTLVGTRPQSRAQLFEVKLAKVAHFPLERTLVVVIRVVRQDGDSFVAQPPPSLGQGGAAEFRANVRLAELRGKSLSGYRIVVQDENGDELAQGRWE